MTALALGWMCSYGPSSDLGSRSVIVCAAAADLRRRTWFTCLSRATASRGSSAHSIMILRMGNSGQNCWIPRRHLGLALMRLMRCLGVELSSSESSEGSIGPGYENVEVLPRLLVKPFDTDLRTVSSPISSGSCSTSLSSSLSHIDSLSADGSVSL